MSDPGDKVRVTALARWIETSSAKQQPQHRRDEHERRQ
jgi:hypothetical protein